MAKIADRYFEVDPWVIREQGFDPAYGEVGESVFSLANEYMGLRGYFEEGYSGQTLLGSYVNGVYEQRQVPKSGYRSMLPFAEFMVNTVDWAALRIHCNGQLLDLAASRFEGFERTLDLRTGLLRRSFVWHPDAHTSLRLTFERFLSMDNSRLGGQRVVFEALTGTAQLDILAGLDFSPLHVSAQRNFWACSGAVARNNSCEILGTTRQTGQKLFAAARFSGLEDGQPEADDSGQFAGFRFAKQLQAGESATLTRLVALAAAKGKDDAAFAAETQSVKAELASLDYDQLKEGTAAWWRRQWQTSDILIEGDAENQQGIRFCIFQMHQTLHTADHSAIVGAKGMTGEAYNGNTFWDTEVYCLPFYLFNNPSAAKSILQFRYDTLPQAKQRAAELDCKGAFYPIATISGRECCDLWQHANLQLQPSTGVAYGLWLYHKLTGDDDFLFCQGAEMLVEICRMLADRGGWDPQTGAYGYYGVMGPDEFQMMVNHNSYTNFMAKKTFCYALNTISAMQEKNPVAYGALVKQTGLQPAETEDWQCKADKMRLLYDAQTGLFEQHDGFYTLPHIDVNTIPVEEFPLYAHWSYDRIYRNDMLKQPDVLMFMLLHNGDFDQHQLTANFNYYEPRCIHESSLSPSVHSILAAQLGRDTQAFDLFRFATRMDLDNYNRNTREGLHTTSIAGSWMNIVYGFGGLRSDGNLLSLSPGIPATWQRYTFRILCGGALLEVDVAKETVCLKLVEQTAQPVSLLLYGQPLQIDAGGLCVKRQPVEAAG